MENQRDDLVVILVGYKERIEVFYESNPRFALCNANHVNIFDYTSEELCKIGKMMLNEQQY
jgi:hypothetical protein